MSIHLKYSPLFIIETSASITGEKLDVFDFKPTKACRKLLQSYGLIFRSSEFGFAVHYKLNKALPAAQQLLAKINQRISFIFVFSLKKSYALVEYTQSFAMTNGPKFYLNNLTGNTTKASDTSLSIDPSLGPKDNTSISLLKQENEEKIYGIKRISENSSIERNLIAPIIKPYGVVEIFLESPQNVTNNLQYSIQLN